MFSAVQRGCSDAGETGLVALRLLLIHTQYELRVEGASTSAICFGSNTVGSEFKFG